MSSGYSQCLACTSTIWSARGSSTLHPLYLTRARWRILDAQQRILQHVQISNMSGVLLGNVQECAHSTLHGQAGKCARADLSPVLK
jgi:hypothetical protein